MSVKEQAAKSVIWSAVERFSVQGIQFVLGIIIARLLLPTDYGVVAMLSFFMAVAQAFIDGGFANALIQKKNPREEDYSTVFYFNIFVSVGIYVLLFIAAPYIGRFFEMDILKEVTRVFALSLVINSFGIVQQARLTTALNFKSQAYASLIAVVVSGGVGLWMAYKGLGVWTLVYQALLNNFVRVLFVWFFSHWMPKCLFSWHSFHGLFGFGSKLLISTLLHTVYTNLYTLIIGKFFASAELGYYNRAFTIAQFPSNNVTNVIVRAVYPIQCRLQDDMEQLKDLFIKYMRMSCYLVFPMMCALCALAEPLVQVLLTDKWLPMVPMLRLLSLAFMWDPVMRINHNMLNVKGRTDYFLYAEIIKKIVAFLILIVSLPFGVIAMCAGLILYAFADIIIIVYYSRKLTHISLARQFYALFPIMLLTGSMGVGMYLITLIPFLTSLYKLCIAFCAGGVYFIVVSWLFHFREFFLLKKICMKKVG